MTDKLRQAAEVEESLREQCASLRRKPTPLADLIPLLQRSADAIATLRSALEGSKQAEPVAYVSREDLADLQKCNGRSLWAESPTIWGEKSACPPAPPYLVPLYASPVQAQAAPVQQEGAVEQIIEALESDLRAVRMALVACSCSGDQPKADDCIPRVDRSLLAVSGLRSLAESGKDKL